MGSQFQSYIRPGIHSLTGDAPAGSARRPGLVPLQLMSMTGGAPRTVSLGFDLLGAGDVAGLRDGAVTRRHPAPGIIDAAPELAAHVEFSATDLPWRYSPKSPEGTALMPWLALLVGIDGDEMNLVGRHRVLVSGAVLGGCDLSRADRFAHVHVTESGPSVSRLLSPCALEAGKPYRAALVPAFQVDGAGTVKPAWAGTPVQPLELPLYDTWTFRTGEKDDFPILAARLKMMTAGDLGPGFGSTQLRLRDSPVAESFPMMGALTAPGASDAAPPAPSVRSWSDQVTVGGRWVLGPPQYDEPWRPTAAPAADVGWATELREDPRRRVAAGLGAFCAIEHQDRLADGAKQQAGALDLAAHDLRMLGLGLAAGKSLFDRRLPPASDGVGRLAILGPLLRRLPAAEGGTADAVLVGSTPRLHGALLSGALRRLIRPGSAVAVQPERPPTVTTLLEAANVCPPPERPGFFTGRLRAARGEPSPAQVNETVQRWPQLRPLRAEAVLHATELGTRARQLASAREQRGCRSVNLGQLGNLVAHAIDPGQPNPPARRRILGRYKGLGTPPLSVFEPELDLPLAMALKELAPQWLLPGRGRLGPDSIVPLAANPRFTDAALVGANHRALGELRWRNVRVRSGWSPLRHFWPRPRDQPDVTPMRTWGPTALGALQHRPPKQPADLLVVVIRSAILRRFPATAVYLLDADSDPDVLKEENDEAKAKAKRRLLPIFKGEIEPDLHYVGFPITPSMSVGRHLILEEPPAKPRFNHTLPANKDLKKLVDGAAYAAAVFYRRTIVAIPMPADPFK